MNSLPQTSQPALIVRGSRFAMPFLVVVMLVIAACYVFFAQSNPFLGFGDVFMLFVVPLGALISMNFTTRAVFFDDRCRVSRTVIFYQNIVSVNRGRFLLTIRYNRPNEARAKPRHAKPAVVNVLVASLHADCFSSSGCMRSGLSQTSS
ncbi:hypothetical protein, partial [Paraburkholderia sp. GAS32]|uniref:hypothetical protein n=1 Tax=Paraburkholderia sp. GAS32 TaxID=3035129 RepID=UPI003D1EB7A8